MGLDAVELVLDVEEAFGVEIPDRDAEIMQTVGQLYDWLVENTKNDTKNNHCLSAATFYILRRGLRELGVDQKIRPATAVIDLLPMTNRRQLWAQLSRHCGLALPNMVRPSWVISAGFIFTLLASVILGYFAYQSTDSQSLTSLTFIISLPMIGLFTSVMTEPYAIFPHRHWDHLRGLSETVLAKNYHTLNDHRNHWNANDVWIVLRSIIVEQLGVEPNEVTRDANFVNDLGCG